MSRTCYHGACLCAVRQTDRGFSVAHVVDELVVPERVDLRTGAITCRIDKMHHFRCVMLEVARI